MRKTTPKSDIWGLFYRKIVKGKEAYVCKYCKNAITFFKYSREYSPEDNSREFYNTTHKYEIRVDPLPKHAVSTAFRRFGSSRFIVPSITAIPDRLKRCCGAVMKLPNPRTVENRQLVQAAFCGFSSTICGSDPTSGIRPKERSAFIDTSPY
jgi:hypothetical protein